MTMIAICRFCIITVITSIYVAGVVSSSVFQRDSTLFCLSPKTSKRSKTIVAFQQQQQQQQQRVVNRNTSGISGLISTSSSSLTTKTPCSLVRFSSFSSSLVGKTTTAAAAATTTSTTTLCATNDKGTAASPFNKKKVAVLGGGGYTGGLVFGFLQRCQALYTTGLTKPLCIGATADTAVRLNRLLSKHFVLAMADESYIKLTNLQSVEYIQKQLSGYDAVIFTTDDLYFQTRAVTGNTYEKSPNDKTMEIYWGSPKGSYYKSGDEDETQNEEKLRKQIVSNFITGAKLTSTIKHAVIVVSTNPAEIIVKMKETKIPYTLLQVHPETYSLSTPDYTFKKGMQGDVSIVNVATGQNKDGVSSSLSPICIEDLAAVCVQVLQTLDWSQSRHLVISSSSGSPAAKTPISSTALRPDQEWCVNSSTIQQKLSSLT